jgi:flavin-dependent dehydrogenase
MNRRFANAELDGKVIGVRGINNYFRKPYGPGWALTGDAGYLKDPSTGLGMGDALGQAFWLADALDAALRGADWETAMGGFQHRRDAELMPFYQMTLWYTQMSDAPTSSVAWLRALLSTPILARSLPFALPGFIADAMPPHLVPMLTSLARGFGATSTLEPVVAADD